MFRKPDTTTGSGYIRSTPREHCRCHLNLLGRAERYQCGGRTHILVEGRYTLSVDLLIATKEEVTFSGNYLFLSTPGQHNG